MTLQECYQILGVRESSSLEDVRKTYKQLVRVWHPDRFPNDPKMSTFAGDKFKHITAAYDTLESHLERKASREQRAEAPKRHEWAPPPAPEVHSDL